MRIYYIDDLLDQFFINLQKTLKVIDGEAIHDLRVAFKKISVLSKVVYIFFPHISNLQSESYRAVKLIFKYAGIIRDSQILLEILKTNFVRVDNTLLRQLALSRIFLTKCQLIELCNGVLEEHRVRQEFHDLFMTIFLQYKLEFQNCLMAYVEDNEKKLERELQSKVCDYHAVRKWIKEQCFILEYLKSSANIFISDELLSAKKQNGNWLGKWHDLEVFNEFLEVSDCEIDKSIFVEINRLQSEIIEKTGLRL